MMPTKTQVVATFGVLMRIPNWDERARSERRSGSVSVPAHLFHGLGDEFLANLGQSMDIHNDFQRDFYFMLVQRLVRHDPYAAWWMVSHETLLATYNLQRYGVTLLDADQRPSPIFMPILRRMELHNYSAARTQDVVVGSHVGRGGWWRTVRPDWFGYSAPIDPVPAFHRPPGSDPNWRYWYDVYQDYYSYVNRCPSGWRRMMPR